MSRLRATLSGHPLDREVATRVDAAQREILAALRACDRMEGGPILKRRAMAVRRDLANLLGMMSSVRRVSTLYDTDDPDLTNSPTPPRPKREVPTAPAAPSQTEGEG